MLPTGTPWFSELFLDKPPHPCSSSQGFMVEKRLLSSKRPSCSSPLCPSPRVYPALKSTPDDFLLHHSPLTTPLSPLLEVSPGTDPPLPPPLSTSSHFQTCRLAFRLLSKELLPHAERPSSLPFAPELHQVPLAVFPGLGGGGREGGVREKGAAAWACCQALPLFLWHDFAPSVLIGE